MSAAADDLVEVTVKVPRAWLQAGLAAGRAETGGLCDPVALAAAFYRMRRLRDQFFQPGLFQEAAWDLLLDLYVARQRRQRISVSSACIAACVPATTGLRYLASLEQLGYIEKFADPNDGRRHLVGLTADATERMANLLERCRDVAGDALPAGGTPDRHELLPDEARARRALPLAPAANAALC